MLASSGVAILIMVQFKAESQAHKKLNLPKSTQCVNKLSITKFNQAPNLHLADREKCKLYLQKLAKPARPLAT